MFRPKKSPFSDTFGSYRSNVTDVRSLGFKLHIPQAFPAAMAAPNAVVSGIEGFTKTQLVSFKQLIFKSNLHYTRIITPKRVTSGGAHLRGLAPMLHNSQRNVAAVASRW